MARGKDVREVMDAMTSPDGLKISGEGGVTDYNDLDNLPKINSVELKGNKTLSQLGIQEELVAGDNITITGNEISATPTDLSDYAKKADVYDKDAADAKFQEILTAGDNITIVGNEISAEQPDVSDFVKATSVYLRPEADVTFQKALTAGDNITIVNDTISAEQPDVSDFVKATAVYLRPEADVTFQKTLTAGDNIVIDTVTGEISAEQPDLSSYVKTTAVYLKDQADIKFQETLTAGYGIDATDLATNQVTVKVDNDTIGFNADGELVANGGGGTTYTAGDGIDIDSNNEISAKLAAGANVTLNTAADGTITIGAAGGGGGSTTISAGDGIAVSATAQGYEVAADPDGTTIGIDSNGKIKCLVTPGQTLGAGTAIDIDANDDINVKLDGTTIHTNASGELEVIGGGGGGGSYIAGDGIDISTSVSGDVIAADVDNDTVVIDSNGKIASGFVEGDGIEFTTSVSGKEIGVKVDGTTIDVNSSGAVELKTDYFSGTYTFINRLNSSDTFTATVTGYKIGQLCTLQITGTVNVTAANTFYMTTMDDIPSAFYPSDSKRAVSMPVKSYNVDGNFLFSIASSGIMSIITDSSTGQMELQAQITYIVPAS